MRNLVRGKTYKKMLYSGLFLLFPGIAGLSALFFLGRRPEVQSQVAKLGERNLYILLSIITLAAIVLILVQLYLKRRDKKEQEKAEPSELSFEEGHEISLERANAAGELDEKEGSKQKLKKPLFLVFGDAQPALNLGSDLAARLKDYPFSWNTVDQGVFVSLRNEPKVVKKGFDKTANWREYLNWLLHTRAKRPLSGIVLILNVNDLASSKADNTVEMITDLLRDSKVQSVPVYVVIRNIDTLVGFSDAFLGSEKSDSGVLGLTFSDKHQGLAHKQEELQGFFSQLNHSLLQGLNIHTVEPDLGQYLFVQQLEGVKKRLLTVVDTISVYGLNPRGLYFTEDLQLNTSLNFITDKLSSDYQYPRSEAKTTEKSGSSNRYSIKNTLRGIVLSESGMVGDNTDFLKTKRNKLLFSYVLTGVLITGTVGLWHFIQQKNVFELESFSQSAKNELSQYKKTLTNASAPPEAYVRTLNYLSPKEEDNSFLRTVSLGLDKNNVLNETKNTHYSNIVTEEFAGAIATEQLNQADKYSLASNAAGQKKAFNALLAVKLLSTPDINDEEKRKTLVKSADKVLVPVLKKYWEDKFLSISNAPQLVGQLVTHLRHSLGGGTGYDMTSGDKQRLKTIQARLSVTPMPQRLYGLLKGQAASQYPTPYDLSLELGEGFDRVFRVKPSAAYIFNRLFTQEGFIQEYLVRESRVAKLAAIDAWVLGQRTAPLEYQGEELIVLQNNIRDLYLKDYKRSWQSAIQSIDFLPATNLSETVAQLKVLSDSGLYRNWLSAINKNTVFPIVAKPESTPIANPEPEEVAENVENLNENVGQSSKDEATEYVTLALQKKFSNYNKLLEKKADDIETTIAALSTYMTDLEEQSYTVKYYALTKVIKKFSAKGEADPINHLHTLARKLPEPLSSQLKQLSYNSWRILLSLAVKDLNQAWGTEVYQYYADNLQGRYPFIKTDREASLESIRTFYGDAGLLDVFYSSYLKPLLGNEGKLNGLNIANIQRVYKHADYIREGLFTPSGEFKVEFKIEPTALSGSYLSSALSLDGVLVKYNHGVPEASHVVWPNPDLAAQASSITLNPLNSGARAEQLTIDGQWGLFRLLDQTQTQSLGDRQREIRFSAGMGVAQYLITMPGSVNPLTKDLFSGFNLPRGLLK